jgi:hypothetical protein
MSGTLVRPAVFRPAPLEELANQLATGADALLERVARIVDQPPTPSEIAGIRRVIAGLDQIAGQLAAAVGAGDAQT